MAMASNCVDTMSGALKVKVLRFKTCDVVPPHGRGCLSSHRHVYLKDTTTLGQITLGILGMLRLSEWRKKRNSKNSRFCLIPNFLWSYLIKCRSRVRAWGVCSRIQEFDVEAVVMLLSTCKKHSKTCRLLLYHLQEKSVCRLTDVQGFCDRTTRGRYPTGQQRLRLPPPLLHPASTHTPLPQGHLPAHHKHVDDTTRSKRGLDQRCLPKLFMISLLPPLSSRTPHHAVPCRAAPAAAPPPPLWSTERVVFGGVSVASNGFGSVKRLLEAQKSNRELVGQHRSPPWNDELRSTVAAEPLVPEDWLPPPCTGVRGDVQLNTSLCTLGRVGHSWMRGMSPR